MVRIPKRRIAASYLPSHYHYWYSLSKLAMDPLYEGVRTAFAGDRAPLLDIGCGIGLLAHCLRAHGHDQQYIGVDSDVEKIGIARQAATRSELAATSFSICDLTQGFPDHCGSIAILDVLQYLEPGAQEQLLANAARRVSADGRLVIRVGLDDGSWRARITRITDRLGHASGWMSTSFKAQPTESELTATFARHGLQAQFRPLWGRTPFNNWLIIATRAAASTHAPVVFAAADSK